MKNKKFYIFLIFLILHFFNESNLMAQTANLGSSITSYSGTNILIPLNFNSFTNIGSMDIRILFDNTKLSFVGIENLSIDAAGTLANAIILSGANSRLNISWLATGSTGVNFANGKFLDIRFNYIGGNTSLNFDPLTCEVADWNGDIVNVSYSNVLIQQSITLQSFNVSGGGNYCMNSNGVSVNLSGSQNGVNYQLLKNGSTYGSLVSGTGNALVWSSLLSGTYTVEAQYNSSTLLMTGNAIVSELSNLAVSANIVAAQNPVTSGSSVTFTATAINGGTNPAYQWYVNNLTVGNNSNQFTYIPSNSDTIKCVVTSNEICAINNPAISNLITMTVNQPLVVSVNLGDSITAEQNTNVYVPLNFSNLINIGSMDLKIEFDSTVLSFVNLDSLVAEASGVLYNVTSTNTKYKILNISWLAQGTSGVNIPNSKFFSMKFLFKGGETNLTFKTNLCEIADWNGDLINITYNDTKIKDNLKTINLTLFIEGLFNGVNMNAAQDEMGNHFGSEVADQINVELHNNFDPSIIEATLTNQNLSVDGNCKLTVPSTLNSSYYIVIKHRNSISIWSALPISFSASVVNYNFTTASTQAYGDNLKEVATTVYAIYTGDVNQDEVVDLSDLVAMDTDLTNGTVAYITYDLNGDGVVDLSDLVAIDENLTNGVVATYP